MIFTPEDLLALGNSPIDGGLSGILLDLQHFLQQWLDKTDLMEVHTSGSTGTPKHLLVSKQKMINSACLTCDYFHLLPNQTLLLCMPLKYIAGKMMVVRALVGHLNLMVVEPSCHPLAEIDKSKHIHFAAMVPLQMYQTLQVKEELFEVQRIDKVLLGGGAIDLSLEDRLQDLSCQVYSSYGMTETLSHIAIRSLNGLNKSANYYPLHGVNLSLSPRGALVISAPLVCNEILETHDIAVLQADGSFSIIGRTDNIINTGGIKVQIEEIELSLSSFLSVPFAVTSVPDVRLGEAVVLLIQQESFPKNLSELLNRTLPRYHRPKQIYFVSAIPMTETGKIDRPACKFLANKLCS